MRAAAVKTHLRIRRLRRLWMRTNNSVCHFPHLPHQTNTILQQQQKDYTSPTSLVPPPQLPPIIQQQREGNKPNTKTKKLSSSSCVTSSPLLPSDSTKDLFKTQKQTRISPPASAPPPSLPPTLFTGIPGAFEEFMGFSGFWLFFNGLKPLSAAESKFSPAPRCNHSA